MKIFLATANLDAIRMYNDMGLVDGITTNPSLLAKEGGDPQKTMEEIFQRRPDLYKLIKKNRFKPFTISDGMVQAYADLAKEKGIPNVLDKKTQKKIQKKEESQIENVTDGELYGTSTELVEDGDDGGGGKPLKNKQNIKTYFPVQVWQRVTTLLRKKQIN